MVDDFKIPIPKNKGIKQKIYDINVSTETIFCNIKINFNALIAVIKKLNQAIAK